MADLDMARAEFKFELDRDGDHSIIYRCVTCATSTCACVAPVRQEPKERGADRCLGSQATPFAQ